MTVGITEEVKERVSLLDSLHRESVKDHERAEKKFSTSLTFLAMVTDILDALPDKTDDVSVYSSIAVYYDGAHVTVSYGTQSEEDSTVVRGQVQKVMGIPAGRKVNSYNGDMSWSFSKNYREPDRENGSKGDWIGHLDISINHGQLAPGCELVQEEITRTEYKISCPEGQEEEVNES